MTDALIRLRLQARDAALVALDAARTQVIRHAADLREAIKHLLRRALDSEPLLDFLFWLRAVADVIAEQHADAIALFRFAALRIRAAYRTPHQRRQDAITFLAESCPALQCA